jgi:acyl-CoA thioester hydrolase
MARVVHDGAMFYRFAAEVPLRWVDVDSAGVVNNATYLSLMEQARYLYCKSLGLMADHRVPFVLAEATVTFVRPGRLGMRCEVSVRTAALGNSSFTMEYEIRGDDSVLVQGKAVLVFVDATLKPTPIPADWRATIAQFEELPG